MSDIEARLSGACLGAGLLNDEDNEWARGQLKIDRGGVEDVVPVFAVFNVSTAKELLSIPEGPASFELHGTSSDCLKARTLQSKLFVSVLRSKRPVWIPPAMTC